MPIPTADTAPSPAKQPGWPSQGQYWHLIEELIALGFEQDMHWAHSVCPPAGADEFALEAAYVICNSGMRAQVARPIYERVRDALLAGRSASTAFGHPGKSASIDRIWQGRATYHEGWLAAGDKLAYLRTLPHIGPVIVYHLAKNFGMPVAKPDRHLQRMADATGETPQSLCERVAAASRQSVHCVDLMLWRACSEELVGFADGRIVPGRKMHPDAALLVFGDPAEGPYMRRSEDRQAMRLARGMPF